MIEVETTASNLSEGARLRQMCAASRVHFTWLGLKKAVKGEVKNEIAESTGTDVKYLTVSKSIIKATEEPIKKLSELKGEITRYWRGCTLPYVEPGWRLIRQDRVETFVEFMTEQKIELAHRVDQLAQVWDDLVAKAKHDLGELANSGDYPTAAALTHCYGVEWDFPSTEPPNYLMDLKPEIYEAEKARVQARFEQAAKLAEEAYLEEFAKLVANLTERLTVGADGEVKVFKNSLIGNLSNFFESMNQLNFRDRGALEELVDKAKELTHGVTPADLRDNGNLRAEIATKFSAIGAQLEGMLVNRPKRALTREKKGGE